MKIVEPAAKLLAYTQLPPERLNHNPSSHYDEKLVSQDPCGDMSRVVERCGRVSWKSEAKIAFGSADDFMTRVVNIRKDESIAEHCSATILFIMDRYASHQLVRHRIGAYTQESTHYINYAKKGEEIEVCRPLGIPRYRDLGLSTKFETDAFKTWREACEVAEKAYFDLIRQGVKHYHARFALPGCLKTEIAVTYNLRIWRYVFGLRCTPNNTPEIVQSMKQGLQIMHELCPPMFEDQYKQFLAGNDGFLPGEKP
jgi:thymidylate synthase (FAD)